MRERCRVAPTGAIEPALRVGRRQSFTQRLGHTFLLMRVELEAVHTS